MSSGWQALPWQSHGGSPRGPDSAFLMSRVQRWMVCQNYLHGAIAVSLTKQTKCLRHLLMLLSSLDGEGSPQWASQPLPLSTVRHASKCCRNWTAFAGKIHVKPYLSVTGLAYSYPVVDYALTILNCFPKITPENSKETSQIYHIFLPQSLFQTFSLVVLFGLIYESLNVNSDSVAWQKDLL